MKTLRRHLWGPLREPVMFMTLGVARVQFGFLSQLPAWIGWLLIGVSFLMVYVLYLRVIFAGLSRER